MLRMDSGQKGTKRQLLALKKELKCWESMFERKHGRRPAKTDIDESPIEIRETYRQYQQMKSSTTAKDGSCAMDDTRDKKEKGGDDVFGAFLNKTPLSTAQSSSGKQDERQATWKLRKWTKGHGYKTVVVEPEEDSGTTGEAEMLEENSLDVSNSVAVATDASIKMTSSLDSDLASLSEGLKIKESTKEEDSESVPILASPRKLKLGRCVSTQWLERCKPDLMDIQSQPEQQKVYMVLSKEPPEVESGSSDEDSELDGRSSASDEVIGSGAGMYERMFGSGYAEREYEDDLMSAIYSPPEFQADELESPPLSPEGEMVVGPSTSSQPPESMMVGPSTSSQPPESMMVGPSTSSQPPESMMVGPSTSSQPPETTGVERQTKKLAGPLDESPLALLEQTQSGNKVIPPNSRDYTTALHGIAQTSANAEQGRFGFDKESTQNQWMLRKPRGTQTGQGIGLKPSQQVQNSTASREGQSKTQTSTKSRIRLRKENTTESEWMSQESKSKSRVRLSKENGTENLEVLEESKDTQELEPEETSRRQAQKGVALISNEKVTRSSDGDAHDTSPVQSSEPHTQERTSRTNVVSDNFVRLNMKVKRYSKKPGRVTGSAYKRKMWKKNQGVTGSGSGGRKGYSVCFKCGKPGHWAKNCTDNGGSKNLGQFAGQKVGFGDLPEDDIDSASLEELVRESPFPSVADAALMARGIKRDQSGGLDTDTVGGTQSTSSSSFLPPPPCHMPPAPSRPGVEPLFQTDGGKIIATPASVNAALKKFGYRSFRPGQEETVMRILSGVSTLLIQSTGSGKSLCYQLPAYLYCQHSQCITLIISPLVALMEDQVRHFPPCLRGACLHTNQTHSQRDKVLCDVVEGRCDVLLLSPEALVSGSFWRGGTYSLSRLPPVAFACIDEVHCVSEWSHNFRPSYLQLYQVLGERLGVRCILGLTATATRMTAISVAHHLGIVEENIISGTALPDNLQITVSCDEDRDEALVQLLQSPRMRDCGSIIIYCTRQQQTERVAQLLRTSLQSLPVYADDPPSDTEDTGKGKGKVGGNPRKRKGKGSGQAAKKRKVNWSADCYHAGMAPARRKSVQLHFMTGNLRIVAATVAFGMGLNKADVRAIIHYNLPKSFESFVQEVGRAGRDGLPAYCHVFIDREGKDLSELRRHAYSSTVDQYSIKQLVRKAFPKCKCKEIKQGSDAQALQETQEQCPESTAPLPLHASSRYCAGHEVAIPIESTVQALDVKEECLATLLCYLDLQFWLKVMNPVHDTCTLKCYGGARQLRALARKVPAVAAAAARLKEQGTNLESSSTMKFSVVGVADSMGWESKIVRSELHGLQYNDRQTGGKSGAASTVLVEFTDPAFRLCSPGDLSASELDYVCNFLYQRVKKQEESEVEKLHLLHAVLRSIASESFYDCFQEDLGPTRAKLKSLVQQYFGEGLSSERIIELGIPVLKTNIEISPELTEQICRDIYSFVTIHSEHTFTGRSVARVFHGISSPCFPAEVWGRQHRFWRRHLDVDFNVLCRIATQKLLELR